MGTVNKIIRVFDLKEDKKIKAKCLLIDISIGKYIELVKSNLEDMDIQFPVGFKVYDILSKYFKPVDAICVVRRNQTSNTGLWHKRAREFNFYLRGFKYLSIMMKA